MHISSNGVRRLHSKPFPTLWPFSFLRRAALLFRIYVVLSSSLKTHATKLFFCLIYRRSALHLFNEFILFLLPSLPPYLRNSSKYFAIHSCFPFPHLQKPLKPNLQCLSSGKLNSFKYPLQSSTIRCRLLDEVRYRNTVH